MTQPRFLAEYPRPLACYDLRQPRDRGADPAEILIEGPAARAGIARV